MKSSVIFLQRTILIHLVQTLHFADFHLEYIVFPTATDNWHVPVSHLLTKHSSYHLLMIWAYLPRVQKTAHNNLMIFLCLYLRWGT